MDRLEKGLFDFGIVFEPHKLKSYEYLALPLYNASVMARMGVGSVLSLNRLILSSEESEMVYRPLNPPVIGMSYVEWKKGRAMSHVSQLFLEELKKCIANHSGEFMDY